MGRQSKELRDADGVETTQSMNPLFDAYTSVTKFRYADSIRTLKRRIAGSCVRLLNLAPNQGEGERIRRGFAAYTAVTMPTGFQILKTVPIQTPAQDDVHWMMADDSGQKIYQNPYYFGSTKSATNVRIDESIASGTFFNISDVTFGTYTITILNAVSNGFSGTDSYYKGWVIKKSNGDTALITSYTLASTTATITVVQDISSTGLNWVKSNTFTMYRNFHDNLGFAPAYNTDIANAPCVISHNSAIYASGGQSSATGNKGLVSQYINQSFFPSDTLHTFTYTGTYVCEERYKPPPSFWSTYGAGNFGGTGLEVDKTYWFAFAYDYGSGIGELNKYETLSFYPTFGAWTHNYLGTSTTTDAVGSVAVTAGGSDYVNAGVTFTGGSGSGATATATISSNAIAFVDVTNGGSGYVSAPTVSFTSGVSSVTIGSAGSGYSSGVGQVVRFTGGGGTGAYAYISSVNGSGGVTGITMLNYGSGFTSAPTADFSFLSGSGAAGTGVIGSGASATATLSTATDANEAIDIGLTVNPATLDKRVKGICIFVAQDTGQTTVRQSDYFFVRYIPISTTDGFGSTWTLISTGVFSTSGVGIIFDGDAWNGRTLSYVDCVGMGSSVTDTSYAYSQRMVVGNRHYLSNVYITSEAQTNREEIFTNPIGGLEGVNAGIIQAGLFPNEKEVFRRAVKPSFGTKINMMAAVSIGDILVGKDRGLISLRVNELDAGNVSFDENIISDTIGCSTLNGFVQLDANDGGTIFFAGYDDVYLYDNSRVQRLIEREDQQDWLYQYREGISVSNKESIVLAYLPEGILQMDVGQSGNNQYALYVRYIPDGWRQVAFKNTSGFTSGIYFKWYNRLQNGTVLGVSTETSPAVYQFSNPTMGTYYYTDSGTAIKYRFDTGNVVLSPSETRDFLLDRIQVSRYLDNGTTGTLEATLSRDGTSQRTYTGIDKTSKYQKLAVYSSDPCIGNTWGLDYNNGNSPETLDTGSDFRILGLYYFGHDIPRERVNESNYQTTQEVGCMSNTIANRQEVIVNETDTSYTFDTPFTLTYVDLSGATVPKYRFTFEPPSVSGVVIPIESVTIVSKTLTGIVLRSSSNNTLVKFVATE